jgi:hypothetical protein
LSRHGGIQTDRQSSLYRTRRSYFAPIISSVPRVA